MAVLALSIHPTHPEPRKIGMAAEVLARDGLGLYPTDTVYALGCALDARKSVERIYRLRQMDRKQPLALLVPGLAEAAQFAVISDAAYRLLRRILPGPYTIVLPATREVPRLLLDKRRQVGIRIPASPIAQALLARLGQPLLTSSAIPPGEEAAVMDAAEGKARWGKELDLVIDGGPLGSDVSTVLSMMDDQIEVLRQGAGPVDGVIA